MRRDRQRVEIGQLARRQPNHPLDEIDAGHLFGDAVLDLNARVDLEEVDIAAGVVEHELDRARGSVARRGARQTGRRSKQRFASLRGEARRRRLLEDLLVTALHRAIALAQREDLAGSVAEDLHLRCARDRDELFEVEPRLLEVRASQAIGGVEGLCELAVVGAASHADAAAPGGALQHHRVADAFRGLRALHRDRQEAPCQATAADRSSRRARAPRA